jgi:hypothetical protein
MVGRLRDGVARRIASSLCIFRRCAGTPPSIRTGDVRFGFCLFELNTDAYVTGRAIAGWSCDPFASEL